MERWRCISDREFRYIVALLKEGDEDAAWLLGGENHRDTGLFQGEINQHLHWQKKLFVVLCKILNRFVCNYNIILEQEVPNAQLFLCCKWVMNCIRCLKNCVVLCCDASLRRMEAFDSVPCIVNLSSLYKVRCEFDLLIYIFQVKGENYHSVDHTRIIT